MRKHTPGPWTMVEHDKVAYILDEGNRTSCGVTSIQLNGNGMNYSENFSNAHLIAAAPEMLAAIERLIHPAADDSDIEFAREVIAKARGGAR